MNAIDIGKRLRKLRERTGLSAKEVAELLADKYDIQMNYRTLFNYEKGRSSPDIDRFLVLCMIYNCTDVLYEFGYTQNKNFSRHNEENEIIKKYNLLSDEGKYLIQNALGITPKDKKEIVDTPTKKAT